MRQNLQIVSIAGHGHLAGAIIVTKHVVGFRVSRLLRRQALVFGTYNDVRLNHGMQAVVNDILQRVDAQGDIYRANYEGTADTGTHHSMQM